MENLITRDRVNKNAIMINYAIKGNNGQKVRGILA